MTGILTAKIERMDGVFDPALNPCRVPDPGWGRSVVYFIPLAICTETPRSEYSSLYY